MPHWRILLLCSCLALLLPSDLDANIFIDMYMPYGSCVGDNGDFYTVNPFRNRIHRIDPYRGKVWAYGSDESGNEGFRSPQGIAMDSSGYLYVADTGNHRVVRLEQDARGAYWDAVLLDKDAVYLPRDIAFDDEDNMYVVDSRHRVLKFDRSGEPVPSFSDGTSHQFGEEGEEPGQLKDPYGVFVDASGNIYVADKDNHRIQKYSPEGVHLLAILQSEQEFQYFMEPHDVAVSAGGLIIVADLFNDRLHAFDQEGRHVSSSTDRAWGISGRIRAFTIGLDAEDNMLYVPRNGSDAEKPHLVDIDDL